MMYCWAGLTLVTLYLFARQRFWLSPTALFYGYFALVYPISYLISYWLQLPSLLFSSPRQISSDKLDHAFFLACLSLGSFCLFRFLVPALQLAFFAPIPQLKWNEVKIIDSRLRIAVILSLLAASLAAGYFIRTFGGIRSIISNLGSIRGGELQGMGLPVYALTYLVPTIMQFWLISSLKNRSKHRRLVLAATIASALFGGLLGFRGPVAILLIQTGCIGYLMCGRPNRKNVFYAALAAAVFATALGVVREASSVVGGDLDLIANVDLASIGPLIVGSLVTRTRGVEALVIMTDFVDRGGGSDYHYFVENVMETILAPVPSFAVGSISSLAAVKNYPLCQKIATIVYGGSLSDAGNIQDIYGGVSYGLVAEAYWNLGWLGVVIVSGLLGYVLRMIEGERVERGPLYITVYKTFAGSMFMVIEGTQVGLNAICLNLFVTLLILAALSFKIDMFANVRLTSIPGGLDATARG